MPSYSAVVFDNDGLLLDTEVAWTRAEEELFRRHGRVFTLDHKRNLLGSSHDVAAAKLAEMLEQPGNGEALVQEVNALVLEEVRHDVAAMPGALELVARLRAAGVPLGLASNSKRVFVERALATAGVQLDTFGAIRAGDEVAAPKPAPDLYLDVCAALGVDAASCAALEDSPTGVASARAAGCFVIGIPSLPGVALDEADLVAPSLGDPSVAAALGL